MIYIKFLIGLWHIFFKPQFFGFLDLLFSLLVLILCYTLFHIFIPMCCTVLEWLISWITKNLLSKPWMFLDLWRCAMFTFWLAAGSSYSSSSYKYHCWAGTNELIFCGFLFLVQGRSQRETTSVNNSSCSCFLHKYVFLLPASFFPIGLVLQFIDTISDLC